MTIQEIAALRKAGRIAEALNGAEGEFARNANAYTAGALFWCLNEVYKRQEDQEAARPLYDRMKALFDNHCPDDEFMQTTVRSIESRYNPFSLVIKEAKEAARNGRIDLGFVNKVQSQFERGELHEGHYMNFGWLLYNTLKNLPSSQSTQKKRLLNTYLKLGLKKPDMLHSMILEEAIKLKEETPDDLRIRNFMMLWGWDSFRPEDWEQFQSDNGHTAVSTVEKLIKVYAKELIDYRLAPDQEFETVLDNALAKFSTSQFLPLYKAKALIAKGDREGALTWYRQMLLNSPTKAYLWANATGLVEDSELRIALLCKALNVERDESFKGKMRLNLAKLLIERGLMANAKAELDVYRDFYTSKGWNLGPHYQAAASRVPADVQPADTRPLYARYIPMAEEFIYDALPSVLAIKADEKLVDDRNRPGRTQLRWTLNTSDRRHWLRNPEKLGLDSCLPNGTALDVKIHNDKIVWAKKTTRDPLAEDWIRKCEGSIRKRTDRNGKTYAIVDNAYINQDLLSGLADGQHVRLIAIREGADRWWAVALKALGNPVTG